MDGFKKTAHDNNLLFISSPFSLEAVDFLEELKIDAYSTIWRSF